jgi:hypothetical protein
VGGFATRVEAQRALRRTLERLCPGAVITLAELVEEDPLLPCAPKRLPWVATGCRSACLSGFAVLQFATGCHRLRPLGSISAPSGRSLRVGRLGCQFLEELRHLIKRCLVGSNVICFGQLAGIAVADAYLRALLPDKDPER